MKILLLLVLATVSFASQAAENPPVGASLSDIQQFLPKALPDAGLLEAARKTDARFTAGQARFVYDLHLDAAPADLGGGSTLYRASALMSDAAGHLFFRKLEISVGGSPRAVETVVVKRDVPLGSAHFAVTTGLIDRMVIVDDVADGITLSFPLGVGGLDEGVESRRTEILTPQYQGATLDRARVNPAGPPPYRGLPIMYITNRNGGNDGVAFHITLLNDQDFRAKGLNFLRRGFESHACMRMRLDDLKQLYTILMRGADSRLPVSVGYFLWNRNERGERDPSRGLVKDIHPYPFLDGSYMHVTYFPDRYPHYVIGEEDHLVEMSRQSGQPDLSRLSDLTSLDQAALRDFRELVDEQSRLR